MRGKIAICVVGGFAFVVGVGGAQSARVPDPAPSFAAVAPVAVAAVETDAERRARLNARMRDMVRKGQGSRLSDIETPRKSIAATPRAVRAPRATTTARVTPESKVSASTPIRDEPTSTIAPPPMRVAAPVRTSRGYTAPRLDLTTPPAIPGSDLECMTQAIYYEARNESEDGQSAVAEVVLNRTRAGTYPRSVCQVVYQRNSRTCQFTFTCDGSIGRGRVNMSAWARAERIAREVMDGRKAQLLPANSVNYHANYVRPSWGRRLERVRQIGAHIFYGRAKGGAATPGASPAEQPRTSGLTFVRNAALDSAYAEMLGRSGKETAATASVPTVAGVD